MAAELLRTFGVALVFPWVMRAREVAPPLSTLDRIVATPTSGMPLQAIHQAFESGSASTPLAAVSSAVSAALPAALPAAIPTAATTFPVCGNPTPLIAGFVLCDDASIPLGDSPAALLYLLLASLLACCLFIVLGSLVMIALVKGAFALGDCLGITHPEVGDLHAALERLKTTHVPSSTVNRLRAEYDELLESFAQHHRREQATHFEELTESYRLHMVQAEAAALRRVQELTEAHGLRLAQAEASHLTTIRDQEKAHELSLAQAEAGHLKAMEDLGAAHQRQMAQSDADHLERARLQQAAHELDLTEAVARQASERAEASEPAVEGEAGGPETEESLLQEDSTAAEASAAPRERKEWERTRSPPSQKTLRKRAQKARKAEREALAAEAGEEEGGEEGS